MQGQTRHVTTCTLSSGMCLHSGPDSAFKTHHSQWWLSCLPPCYMNVSCSRSWWPHSGISSFNK